MVTRILLVQDSAANVEKDVEQSVMAQQYDVQSCRCSMHYQTSKCLGVKGQHMAL